MEREIETWRKRGEAARLAHEAVNNAFREGVREGDPARYDALLGDFRAKTSRALPTCEAGFLAELASGETRAIETGISFLEADPWFFRSGYETQALIRHLKRATLTDSQRVRLGRVVVAAVDGRDRVEFRHFCRLACAVWSDELDEAIAERMSRDEEGIRRRATWVAEAAIAAGKA